MLEKTRSYFYEDAMIDDDAIYMDAALEEARKAMALDEVPIGAVVVKDGTIISRAFNRREIDHDPAGHAEFIALREASQVLGAWRLSGCCVYVTLEPCLMCAGLMYQARVDRCVYGAADPKAGALGSLYRINEDERLNHTFEVTSGVRAQESATLLSSFFAEKRSRRNRALVK
jgi:tRNA(adenine34) deaminase